MLFPSHDRRADEKLSKKLGLILGRMGSVRTRLNSLAWQHAIFYTLAILIAASASIFAGAYVLSPLAFLISHSGNRDRRRSWHCERDPSRMADAREHRARGHDR